MKHSLGILALGLAFTLTACGGSATPKVDPADAEYEQCAQDWAKGVAELKGGATEDYLDDPDVVAVCEGFRDFDETVGEMPAYTPAPAAEVDPACLREYAESVVGEDGIFPGMTVEEIMEDPMASFSCE